MSPEKELLPRAKIVRDKPLDNIKEMAVESSEGTAAYREAQAVVREFWKPVEELAKKNALENPRAILFGSSAYEFKAPSDLDLLVVYDALDTHLSPEVERELSGSASARYLELLEKNLYEEPMAHGKFKLSNTSHDNQSVQFEGIDYKFIRRDALLEWLNLTAVENRQLVLDQLKQIAGRAPIGNWLESVLTNWDVYSGVELENNEDRSNATDTIDTLRKYIGTLDPEREDVKKIVNLLDDNKYTESDQLKAISHHLANLILHCLPEVDRKRLHKLFYNYKLGQNWIQAAFESGGVLIAGENIRNEDGQTLVKREDKGFLSSSN